MVLIGPTSSNVDFSPHGLLEKVLTPFVVHTQIWPPDASGGTAACIGAGTGACAGSGSETGADIGADSGATAAGVAGAGDADGADDASAAGGAFSLAVLLVEIAVNATATAVADRPPSMKGSKSRSFFICRLSSAVPENGMNIATVSRLLDHGTDADSYVIRFLY
jgi:hypothetical protein